MYGSGIYIKILSNKALFVAALALQVFCLVYRDIEFRNTLRYSLQSISLLIIVPAIVNVTDYHKIKQVFSNSVLVYIGKLSYSIYLMHMIAIDLLDPIKASIHITFYYLGVTLLTMLLAMFSYYTVEEPFIKLRMAYSAKRQVKLKSLGPLTYS
jgi:peptidoglycan/LPS O-acetylase OafA/YrhL